MRRSTPTDTTPFSVPVGDRLLDACDATLEVTDQLAATFVGGPSGDVPGRLFLTTRLLAFRPRRGQAHAQEVTLPLDEVVGVSVQQDMWFGLIKRGAPKLKVQRRWPLGAVDHRLRLAEPALWAAQLRLALATPPAQTSPALRLDAALEEGERQRGRYTRLLEELSFPQGFWHTEDLDALLDLIPHTLGRLGLGALVQPSVWQDLDLEVEPETGPEDYETGPGSEHAGRLEQIERVLTAINAALPPEHPQRFYAFAPDLPRWEASEPCWLLLTAAQRARLLELGVLREEPAG